MLIKKTPQTVLQAITSIQAQLPDLIGDDWSAVEPTLMVQIESLKVTNAKGKQVRALLRTVSDYPNAYNKLQLELKRQALWNDELEASLLELARTLNLEPTLIPSAVEVGLRVLTIDDETQKTIGVLLPQDGTMRQSIQINFRKLSGLLGAGLALGAGLEGVSLLAAGGILSLVASTEEALPHRLSVEETSVFLGVIYSQNDNHIAHEAKIMSRSNQEREQCNLPPLTEPQLKQALNRLYNRQVIESLGNGQWCIIDTYILMG